MYVPLHVQGDGRIDNPKLFAVLYAATTRVAAIGASLARFPVWSAVFLNVPRVPGSVRAVAELRLMRGGIVDLDDPPELHDRGLRPSRVVTPDRETTQSWAREIFEEGPDAGVSWWSEVDSRWAIVGLWDFKTVRVVRVQPLLMDDPDLLEAAKVLRRPIMA